MEDLWLSGQLCTVIEQNKSTVLHCMLLVGKRREANKATAKARRHGTTVNMSKIWRVDCAACPVGG